MPPVPRWLQEPEFKVIPEEFWSEVLTQDQEARDNYSEYTASDSESEYTDSESRAQYEKAAGKNNEGNSIIAKRLKSLE